MQGVRIHILLVSEDDWSLAFKIPDNVDLDWYKDIDEEVESVLYDLVILNRDITVTEYRILMSSTKAYCLYVTENARISKATQNLMDSKFGKRLYTGDVQAFLDETCKDYFGYSYGERFRPEFLSINQLFQGSIEFRGNYNVRLTGDFGDEYSQIAYWKQNIAFYDELSLSFYFEYMKSENVSVKLRIIKFKKFSTNEISDIWEIDEEQLKQPFTIDNDAYGSTFVSILAKGSGFLNIISLHTRHSRHEYGFFLPGGARTCTSTGEELFYYFDPADLKPPLSVYFSGYRTQEGFEGYYMMRSMKCPFLLISDPRLEGGAFYLGNSEFENKVISTIKKYMKKLNFSSDELIFSGASMGTFGSLYYACALKPHALILGKPLANIGNVAKNERLVRAGGFGTSLDLMMKNYNGLDETDIESMNQRLWSKFTNTDWKNTKFIISYLYEDDYDSTGYQDILAHLHSEGVQVYGKGIHGHHNDNTRTVMSWFKSQYKKVLKEDYKRR